MEKENIQMKSSIENTTKNSNKSTVYLVFVVTVVLFVLIVNLVQFVLNPVNMKVNHVEVFLVSPMSSGTTTTDDMSMSFYVDFTSGSSLFTAGLSSTSCDVNYLSLKEDGEPHSTFLSNFKVSDVALKPTTHMFATQTTSHEITFDVSNTQYESMMSALQAESSTLINANDKSFLEATCKTTMRFGALSTPYTHRQLVSLADYKSSLQSEVSALKALIADPNELVQSASVQIKSHLTKIMKPAAPSTTIITSRSAADTHPESSAPADSASPSQFDQLTQRYQNVLSSFVDSVGYVVVHTSEMVLSLDTAVVVSGAKDTVHVDNSVFLSSRVIKAAVVNKQREVSESLTIASRFARIVSDKTEKHVASSNATTTLRSGGSSILNHDKQLFDVVAQDWDTLSFLGTFNLYNYTGTLPLAYDDRSVLEYSYGFSGMRTEVTTASFDDVDGIRVLIVTMKVTFLASYYPQHLHAENLFHDMADSVAADFASGTFSRNLHSYAHAWRITPNLYSAVSNSILIHDFIPVGSASPLTGAPTSDPTKSPHLSDTTDDWLPSAVDALSDALSQIKLDIPAGIFDTRSLSFDMVPKLLCQIGGKSEDCSLADVLKTLTSHVTEKNALKMRVSMVTSSAVAHGLVRSAAQITDNKSKTATKMDLSLSFASGHQIQTAVVASAESKKIVDHVRRLTDSSAPSESPSVAPTATPSDVPTIAPSVAPSQAPSAAPSLAPSTAPVTSAPTMAPTTTPSASPSAAPTASPSFAPSAPPTASPSFAPSAAPTNSPSFAPSAAPTASPSFAPSAPLTASPSFAPSAAPTNSPSYAPSAAPTMGPSHVPSTAPSHAPSTAPTVAPSCAPTAAPSVEPSTAPSHTPTVFPVADTSAPSEAPVEITSVPSEAPFEYIAPTATPPQDDLIDHGINAVIKLAPSILAFLEKRLGVSPDDFVLGEDMSCVTISGLNLDGSFCSYTTTSVTRERNSTSSILGVHIVDTNQYGSSDAIVSGGGASDPNTFDFQQEIKQFETLKMGYHPVFGPYNYSYCMSGSWIDDVWVCESYYTYHCDNCYLGDEYSLESVMTGQVLFTQTLMMSVFDFYMNNAVVVDTDAQSVSFYNDFGYAEYSVYALALDGDVGLYGNDSSRHSMDVDVKMTLKTDNERGLYTSEFSFANSSGASADITAVEVKFDFIQVLPTVDILVNMEYSQSLQLFPKMHNITYSYPYYNTKGNLTWATNWYTYDTLINGDFDFKQSLYVGLSSVNFIHSLRVNPHDRFSTWVSSLSQGSNQLYEVSTATQWLIPPKLGAGAQITFVGGLGVNNEANHYTTQFVVSQTAEGHAESIGFNVKQTLPVAKTFFEVSEVDSIVEISSPESYNMDFALLDGHMIVNDQKVYGTTGLVHIQMPNLSGSTDTLVPAEFQFRLSSDEDSASQLYVNQFASLAFIAETEDVEGQISSSMIAGGSTVYDADALLKVDTIGKTYTLQGAEYSNTLYGTISGDYSHAHGLKSLFEATTSMSSDNHYTGGQLITANKPTGAPTRAPPTSTPSAAPISKPTPVPVTVPTEAPFVGSSSPPTARPSTAPSRAPSKAPFVGSTFPPTVRPFTRPTPRPSMAPNTVFQPGMSPTLAPSKAPTPQATIVQFGVTYPLVGVTASVLTTSPTAQAALIQTVKTCLTADEDARRLIAVKIKSITDSTRRLSRSGKGSNAVHLATGAGGVVVDFDIQCNMEEQNFASPAEGYSAMSDAFTGAAVSGTFTSILHDVASSAAFLDTTMQNVDGSTNPPVVSAPTMTTTDSSSDGDSKKTVLSVGAIIAIAVGGAAFLIGMVLAVIYLCGGFSGASVSQAPMPKGQNLEAGFNGVTSTQVVPGTRATDIAL